MVRSSCWDLNRRVSRWWRNLQGTFWNLHTWRWCLRWRFQKTKVCIWLGTQRNFWDVKRSWFQGNVNDKSCWTLGFSVFKLNVLMCKRWGGIYEASWLYLRVVKSHRLKQWLDCRVYHVVCCTYIRMRIMWCPFCAVCTRSTQGSLKCNCYRTPAGLKSGKRRRGAWMGRGR